MLRLRYIQPHVRRSWTQAIYSTLKIIIIKIKWKRNNWRMINYREDFRFSRSACPTPTSVPCAHAFHQFIDTFNSAKQIINHNHFDGIRSFDARHSTADFNQMPSKIIRKPRNALRTEQLIQSTRRGWRIEWNYIGDRPESPMPAPHPPHRRNRSIQPEKNHFVRRFRPKWKLIAMNSVCFGRSVVSVSARCLLPPCVCVFSSDFVAHISRWTTDRDTKEEEKREFYAEFY